MDRNIGKLAREAYALSKSIGTRYVMGDAIYSRVAANVNARGSFQLPLVPSDMQDMRNICGVLLAYISRRNGKQSLPSFDYAVAAMDAIEDLPVDGDVAVDIEAQLLEANLPSVSNSDTPFNVPNVAIGDGEIRAGDYIFNAGSRSIGIRLSRPGNVSITGYIFEKQHISSASVVFTAVRSLFTRQANAPATQAVVLVVNGARYQSGDRIVLHKDDDIVLSAQGPCAVILYVVEVLSDKRVNFRPRYQTAISSITRLSVNPATHVVISHLKYALEADSVMEICRKLASRMPEALLTLEVLMLLATAGVTFADPPTARPGNVRDLAHSLLRYEVD